jgi:bifunctional N-acetylglucosamine-1-phosphate-uridyltransferase/glucosamine-1-phosphate-acetyltransferase GlmU-like protein
VIVIAPAAEEAFTRFAGSRDGIELAVQHEPDGMLPAILCARAAVEHHHPDDVWITWCDQIGISQDTVRRLEEALSLASGAACVFPTVRQTPPYIHLVRDPNGRIIDVLQKREGAPMPLHGESDAGLFVLRRETYLRPLSEYEGTSRPGQGTGERNFLPFLPWLAQRAEVKTIELRDSREALGVNTPDDLRAMEAFLRERP